MRKIMQWVFAATIGRSAFADCTHRSNAGFLC